MNNAALTIISNLKQNAYKSKVRLKLFQKQKSNNKKATIISHFLTKTISNNDIYQI